MIKLKKPFKILLVEDNVLNQKLMSFNLSKIGFDIHIVDNGIEALKRCNEIFFDIILMDIMMPNMDGFQATKEIRTIETITNSKSYIIGLSASVLNSDKEKCIESGMDYFMQKPFDIDIFFNILEKQHFI